MVFPELMMTVWFFSNGINEKLMLHLFLALMTASSILELNPQETRERQFPKSQKFQEKEKF